MKKAIWSLIGIITFLFIAWLLCTGFPRSMGEDSYGSVKEFELSTSKEFYNFYAPQYYFDKHKEKKTLKDINKVNIQYQDTVDDYFITLTGNQLGDSQQIGDIQITYSVSSYSDKEKSHQLVDHQLIDDQYMLYLSQNDYYIQVLHFYNEEKIISIGIDIGLRNDFYSADKLKDIVIQIMKDSIDENEIN